MTYLLDTCACIWMTLDEALSNLATDAINREFNSGQPLYVSPFTAWEFGMLTAKGRIKTSLRPEAWFDRLIGTEGIELTILSPAILLASHTLPGTPPNDPADRIIIATARELGLSIITRDGLILDYAKQGYVQALAC